MKNPIQYRTCNELLTFLRMPDGSLLPLNLSVEDYLDLHLRESGRRAFMEMVKVITAGNVAE